VRSAGGHPCAVAASRGHARRSGLFGCAGYGYCLSFAGYGWAKLCDVGHLRGDGDRVWPGQPQLYGERYQARQMLTDRPSPPPGARYPSVPTRSWPSRYRGGLRQPAYGLDLIRPARKIRKSPVLSELLRQRGERSSGPLKNHLRIERHGLPCPPGLWPASWQRCSAQRRQLGSRQDRARQAITNCLTITESARVSRSTIRRRMRTSRGWWQA